MTQKRQPLAWLKGVWGALTGGNDAAGDRDGLYYHVRPRHCPRIVRLRIHRYNDLSRDEQGKGYFCRKVVTVAGCPQQAILELRFDAGRRLREHSCAGGELVTAEEFAAQGPLDRQD